MDTKYVELFNKVNDYATNKRQCRRCFAGGVGRYSSLCSECLSSLVVFEVEKELKNPKVYVYALINTDNEVLYIGQSNNPYARASQHYVAKQFDSMMVFLECSSLAVALKAETKYIKQFQPPLNKAKK